MAEAPAALDLTCTSCGATLRVEAHEKTAICPYCDSTTVVERGPVADRPDPAFVLGFVLDAERAARTVVGWVRSRGFFAHRGLLRAAIEKSRTRAVYVPAYLYGAVAHARFDAQIGEDYQVSRTERVRGPGGRTTTRVSKRTETEWFPLSGAHASYVLDIVVSASKGLRNAELESVEPFDLRAIHRYAPASLSGWLAEEPSLARDECLALARREAEEKVRQRIAAFLPGDRRRDVRTEVRLESEVADLVLVPVWSFAVRYADGKPAIRLVVNGQTGKVGGKVPLSWPRVALAVVVGAALLLLLAHVFGGG